MDQKTDTPAAPATINDAGLAADLLRLEAGAAADPALPPEVAAMRAQEQAAQVNAVDEWHDLICGIAQPSFDIFCPNWKITPQKTDAWARAVAPAMAKYFPEAANAGPEVTALLATAMLFGPLIGVPRVAPEAPAAAAA